MFHDLVDAACRLQIGGQHFQRGFHALGRAFTHTTMSAACRSFGGGTLPQGIVNAITGSMAGSYRIPREIQNIASLFKELQEKRHMADYDLATRFKRSEVRSLIDEVKVNVDRFNELKATDDRSFFLACLLSWKELQAR